VPAPDTARSALAAIAPPEEPPSGSLLGALAGELGRRAGITIPGAAWDLEKLPGHLRMTFRVEDEQGRALAEGTDLPVLQHRLRQRVKAAVSAIAGAGIERSRLTRWDVGELPRTVEREAGGRTVAAYPALVDEDGAAAVRVLPTAQQQAVAMRAGTRRLLLHSLGDPLGRVQGQVEYALTNVERLTLAASPYPSTAALLEDCLAAAVDDLVERHGGPAWDGEAFAALLDAVRANLDATVLEVVRTTARVLDAWRGLDRTISSTGSPPLLPMLRDVREQLDALVHNSFVAEVGRARLPDLVRYLTGIARRLQKAPENVGADRGRMDQVHAVEEAYRAVLAEQPPARQADEDVRRIRWMLEEFRLSLFAQGVRTAYPISAQRIHRALDAL